MATAGAVAAGVAGFPMLGRAAPRFGNYMILGVDGMDPTLLRRLMDAGRMPNCRRLAQQGCFHKIATSDPPQSPVAWSNFISGTNPGGHGIFDFIARDAETLKPHLATARTTEPTRKLPVGKFSLPLGGGGAELLRKGPTLWSILEEAGIDATAFKVPVNFPPSPTTARTISGITTPDVHGSYGVFCFFSSVPGTRSQDVAGGRIQRVFPENHSVMCELGGPVNTLHRETPAMNVPVTVDLDPDRPEARIRVQGRDLVLRQGEWSDWVVLDFPMIPFLAETSGICRFYLKQAKPYLELYVSPVNLNPDDPAMPICTPDSYSKQLVRDVGYFYTQGMPEDTAALSSGVFDDDEFRKQSTFVIEERMKFLRYELDRYRGGFFYFYFSSLDLNSHAFWRALDPGHPLYTPELAAAHGDFLPSLYERIDEGIGWAMECADDQTMLAVVSDHGFVPFRRQFNLNSWLADHGFASLRRGAVRGATNYFMDTDWGRTKAYGLGINSLYLNVRGREPDGIVAPGEDYEQVIGDLVQQLEAVRDPETGDRVVTHAFRPEQIYSGPYAERAPDLVVSYNRNYRASWETILGTYPEEQILDNLDPWSGDHCMDKDFLSGTFVCNQPITVNDPALYDVAPTILTACGITPPAEMTGRDLLAGT